MLVNTVSQKTTLHFEFRLVNYSDCVIKKGWTMDQTSVDTG